jgi:hypothetical protein
MRAREADRAAADQQAVGRVGQDLPGDRHGIQDVGPSISYPLFSVDLGAGGSK